MNIIDRKWGSLVDKETNAFNGMIGMVQRRVGVFYDIVSCK